LEILLDADGFNVSTASLEVRKSLYPSPRAMYLTCESTCPWFCSKARGKAAKLARNLACANKEPAFVWGGTGEDATEWVAPEEDESAACCREGDHASATIAMITTPAAVPTPRIHFRDEDADEFEDQFDDEDDFDTGTLLCCNLFCKHETPIGALILGGKGGTFAGQPDVPSSGRVNYIPVQPIASMVWSHGITAYDS
jgi:hypothetical protein